MNHTISLGLDSGRIHSESERKLILMDSNSVLIPENSDRIGNAFALVNAAVFTYFRSKVYKYLLKQFRMKELTPINVLTLIVCLVQHLEVGWGLMYEVMMEWVHNGYENQIMPWFCMVSSHFLFSFWGYSALGGLGIAVYRIMLIKHHHLVHETIGRKWLLFIILFSEVLILSLSLAMMSLSDSLWQPIRPPCFHLAKISTLESIDAYNQTFENSSILYFHKIDKVFRGVLFLTPIIAEIFIYVVFFRHLYKHDNNESLKKLLGIEVVKERNMRNAMTFLSLFFSFLVETLFLILIIISQVSAFHHRAPMILRKVTLSAIAIVEVITSRELHNA